MVPFFVDHFTVDRREIDKRGRRVLKPFLELWRYGNPVETVEVRESDDWREKANGEDRAELEEVLQICKGRRGRSLALHVELEPFLDRKLIRFGISESRFRNGGLASMEKSDLAIRAKMMIQIVAFVSSKGWDEAEGATNCGVNPMRFRELLRGDFSRFTVEDLVKIAIVLGQELRIELQTQI